MITLFVKNDANESLESDYKSKQSTKLVSMQNEKRPKRPGFEVLFIYQRYLKERMSKNPLSHKKSLVRGSFIEFIALKWCLSPQLSGKILKKTPS